MAFVKEAVCDSGLSATMGSLWMIGQRYSSVMDEVLGLIVNLSAGCHVAKGNLISLVLQPLLDMVRRSPPVSRQWLRALQGLQGLVLHTDSAVAIGKTDFIPWALEVCARRPQTMSPSSSATAAGSRTSSLLSSSPARSASLLDVLANLAFTPAGQEVLHRFMVPLGIETVLDVVEGTFLVSGPAPQPPSQRRLQEAGLLVIRNLSFWPVSKVPLVSNGRTLPVLLSALKSGEERCSALAASTLWALVYNQQKAASVVKVRLGAELQAYVATPPASPGSGSRSEPLHLAAEPAADQDEAAAGKEGLSLAGTKWMLGRVLNCLK